MNALHATRCDQAHHSVASSCQDTAARPRTVLSTRIIKPLFIILNTTLPIVCGHPLAYSIHSAWATHQVDQRSTVLSIITKALAHHNIRATFQVDESIAQELQPNCDDADDCPVVQGHYTPLPAEQDHLPLAQVQQVQQDLQEQQDLQDDQDHQGIQVKVEVQVTFEISDLNDCFSYSSNPPPPSHPYLSQDNQEQQLQQEKEVLCAGCKRQLCSGHDTVKKKQRNSNLHQARTSGKFLITLSANTKIV